MIKEYILKASDKVQIEDIGLGLLLLVAIAYIMVSEPVNKTVKEQDINGSMFVKHK